MILSISVTYNQNIMEVFKHLPLDVVNHCLSYDKRFKIRRGEIIQRIEKDDYRYAILKEKPIINYRSEIYSNSNMHASYLDGRKITENGAYCYSIIQFMYSTKNISYYIRKIDAASGMEVSMFRYEM